MELEMHRQIIRNPAESNFKKIRPEGGKSLHADGRTDGQTERAMDVLHNFATAPINGARFTVSDSERIINRNILLQTETHMMFEPVRTQ